MKLDILAFGAHPDDAELACGGTLLKHIHAGKKVGVADLTRGELGTRGSAETRDAEALAASAILGLSVRENLKMADGFFADDKEHQLKVVEMIRKYQPEIVIANAVADRHPDHGRAASLVSHACFFAALLKVKTTYDGSEQQAWKVKVVYHTIQDRHIKPDFAIDISAYMEKKMEAVLAYRTQFFNADSSGPVTAISTKEFLDALYARATEYGRPIGAKYAEGFTAERILGVNFLSDLF